MKRILIFLVLSILFYASNAQITKHNWMVGGCATALREQSESVDNFSRDTRIILLPDMGYFLADKFAAGLRPGVDIITINLNGNKNSAAAYSAGPFIRYYFLPPARVVNLFAEADYEHIWHSDGEKTDGYKFSAGPVVYFNSSVGLEFSLNYENQQFDGGNKVKTLFIGIGFQIHLEKDNE